MRALGMAGKLSLPLLSAAAYAIYAMAHRGPLNPDLISFLIPFDSNPLPGSRPCRSSQAQIEPLARPRLRFTSAWPATLPE
jgi:hypothetical protein